MTDDFGEKLRRVAEHFNATIPGILDWLQSESTRRGVPLNQVLEQFLELVESGQ